MKLSQYNFIHHLASLGLSAEAISGKTYYSTTTINRVLKTKTLEDYLDLQSSTDGKSYRLNPLKNRVRFWQHKHAIASDQNIELAQMLRRAQQRAKKLPASTLFFMTISLILTVAFAMLYFSARTKLLDFENRYEQLELEYINVLHSL